ncbi:DUF4302 domain-containing protein [Chitinophaga sp. G-6-1-13]|uniref:DUF4302 domain-containing protein n=1 Tax=Chitinophaga fulva TaxID=2728842 RepID=A0A848GQN2_9BACT|nr:DUF4302 domain-containing protein [Chitinophaga fulva]NML40704.1 DUF4302 domain-containing protein [Chitinophaga fulva]
MKNLYKLLFVISVLVTGCSRSDVDLVFKQTPDERMSEQQQQFNQMLIQAQYGWKITNSTLLKGNFGFYMDFDFDGKKDRVCMVSDINDTSSTVVQVSAYRVKLVNAPILSFETYNYIHLLSDPNPGVSGGVVGQGFKGDNEFEFVRVTPDSMFLAGRKFRTEMILVKATKQEQEAYLNGGYLANIKAVKAVFASNKVSVFDYGGVTYQIIPNTGARRVGIMSVVNNEIKLSSGNFSYSVNGMELSDRVQIGNTFITKILLEDNKLFVQTKSGEKIEVRSSQTALLPLNQMIGLSYMGLNLPFLANLPGTNPAGTTILKQLSLLVLAYPNSYDKSEINLVWDVPNKKIIMEGLLFKGNSIYATRFRYDYDFNPTTGLYKLSNKIVLAPGYATYNVSLLDTFLQNNEFALDYYFDSGNMYGKITSKNGSTVMTFMLY